MLPTFYIRTFGCQMNEHDSNRLSWLLGSYGYRPANSLEEADIVIFNTCTVRAKPHHKAISEAGRVIKMKRDRKLIVGMMGCVAAEEGDRLFEVLPGLDFVVSPDMIREIPNILERIINGDGSRFAAVDFLGSYEPVTKEAPSLGCRVSEYVAIMKGCNNFCTFCIVPYVRGREASRPPHDILDEIQRLTSSGVKEVILLGQNVNSYSSFGLDFPGLVRLISSETDILRIRYTSPHPRDFSKDLVLEHANNPKLMPHAHLPVQAGSNSVLKRMRRGYTREEYLDKVRELKNAVPGIAITTDIIVGFPGEREDDFLKTLSLMEEVGFDGIFAFKYSPRPGTYAAAHYLDDVTKEEKEERLSRVLELNSRIVKSKHAVYMGRVEEILVEGHSKKGGGELSGRTRTNVVVNFAGGLSLVGRLQHVKITWAGLNSMKGEIVN